MVLIVAATATPAVWDMCTMRISQHSVSTGKAKIRKGEKERWLVPLYTSARRCSGPRRRCGPGEDKGQE